MTARAVPLTAPAASGALAPLLQRSSGVCIGLSTLGVLGDALGLAGGIDLTMALVAAGTFAACLASLLGARAAGGFHAGDAAVTAFGLYALVRSVMTGSAEALAVGALTAAALFAYYGVPRLWWDREAWHWCLTAALAVASAAGLLLLTTGSIEVENLRGRLGDLPSVGLSLTFVFAPAAGLVLLLRPRRASATVLAAVASGIGILVMLRSGARGGILAVSAATVACYALAFSKRKARTLGAGLVLLAFVAVLVLAYPRLLLALLARLQWLTTSDPSFAERVVLFGVALDQIQLAPVFGVGPYRDYPHNIVLELLAQYGVAGAVPFLVFVAFVLVSTYRAVREHASHDAMAAAGLFLAYLALHQVSVGLYMSKWLFLAAARLAYPAERDGALTATAPVTHTAGLGDGGEDA